MSIEMKEAERPKKPKLPKKRILKKNIC